MAGAIEIPHPPEAGELSGLHVRGTTPSGAELRLLAGERARVESGTTGPLVPFTDSDLGTGWGIQDGAGPDDVGALVDVEVDLVGLHVGCRDRAHRILCRVLADDAAAAAIVDLVDVPDMSWHTYVAAELPAPLTALGAASFELPIATFRSGGASCRRRLRVVVCDTWLVTLWHVPAGRGWDLDLPRLFALPAARDRSSHRTRVEGASGHARLARLLLDVARHHEWAAELIAEELELWEQRLHDAGAGTAAIDVREEQRRLAQIATALTGLQEAERAMRRRAETQPAFPAVVRAEVVERCGELRLELARLRSELREASTFLLTAAAARQLELAEQQTKRERDFNLAAGFVTAFVLVPSLVVGLYSTQVKGLPGQGETAGLGWVVSLSLVGAVVTVVLLVMAWRLRLRRAIR
jgi:hypothetical protein